MDLSKILEQVRRRVVPGGTALERAVTSGVWEGGLNSLNRVLQLAKVTILAHLLPPEEFGILGIGFLTLAIFESFSKMGLNAALIQQEDTNVNRYLDTAWILRIGRGLLLAGTIFFIAPYAAMLFEAQRATNVIRALGIGPLLLGLKNPGAVYFRKNLQFHRRFAQILSGTIVNFCVAVTFGILIGNVWALVAGTVAGNITSVIVSYQLQQYRPGLNFNLSRARELFDFGKWITGSSIVGFLQNQGDDIFVGYLLGATPLAFYQMAYRFSNAPATELSDVINKVTFPTLSQVQNNRQQLRNGYFRTLRFSTFLAFPTATGIVVAAPSFVRVFLGEAWLPTVPIMQALAIWGGLRALDSSHFSVLHTVSRPDLVMKLKMLRVGIIAISIVFVAEQFGLLGIASVLVLAAVLVAPIEIYITLQMLDAPVQRCLRNLMHPLLGCTFMAVVLLQVSTTVAFPSPVIEFISLILLGVPAYALYMKIAMRFLGYGIGDDLAAVAGSLNPTG